MASIYQLDGESLQDVTVDNEVPLGASQDAFDLRGSENTLVNCFTYDTRCRFSAHSDHTHLIPTGAEPNAQYFGAIGYNNTIIGGGLESNGSMQGIFSSDGCQVNLTIVDQVIDTESQHEITQGGMLSGMIANCKRKNGDNVNITLEPLRIGGGLKDAFYVLSFTEHEYEEITTDQPINDLRKVKHRVGAKYVENFDLNLFRQISESRADKYQSTSQHLSDIMAEYESRSGHRLTDSNYYISDDGLKDLIQSEGFIPKVYHDSRGLNTIGVGHLLTDIENRNGLIKLSDGRELDTSFELTEEQVMQLLRDDLTRFNKAVNQLKNHINQGQFDALISFAFNIGVRGFLNSTVFKRIKANRHEDVPSAMLMWNKPSELIPRRTREAMRYSDAS